MDDRPVFAVAGLWQTTEVGNAFATVTCDANSLVEPIHPKAMVTIPRPSEIDTWLRGIYDEIRLLQRPFEAERMTVRGPIFPTREPAAPLPS